MSKYVREVDSIQELRNTPVSDRAAAHVRTPTGRGGIFVPFDSDPFGAGDDGGAALQAKDGWWVRKRVADSRLYSSADYGTGGTSVMDAINAAGTGGVVEIKADSGELTTEIEINPLDDQTILLNADIFAIGVASVFNIDGVSGVTILANGHTIRGPGRDKLGDADETQRGIEMTAANDCHVTGTVNVRDVARNAVQMEDAENCTLGTVIARDVGGFSGNSNFGDAFNYGSGGKTKDCHVETVVGFNPARHTVTWGSKTPVRCSVGTILSKNPGGSHFDMENALNCSVGRCYGTGARSALNASNPGNTYETFPEIGLIATSGEGAKHNQFGSIVTKDPTGGNAAGVGIGNDCQGNQFGFVATINSTGFGISLGFNAGDCPGNEIQSVYVTGAASDGIFIDTGGCSIHGGIVEGNGDSGIKMGAPNDIEKTTYIGSVQIRNNGQSGNDPYGLWVPNSNWDNPSYLLVERAVMEDTQQTATQEKGVRIDTNAGIFTGRHIDASGSPTPYSFSNGGRIRGRFNTPTAASERFQNTQSGNGSDTTFTIPHSLPKKPRHINVTPITADARGVFSVENIGFNSIDVVYDSAPPNGTDNLEWSVELEV